MNLKTMALGMLLGSTARHPVPEDTLFRIGSIFKGFIALACKRVKNSTWTVAGAKTINPL